MEHNNLTPWEQDGFAWVRGAIGTRELAELGMALTQHASAAKVNSSRRGESVYALRNVLGIPTVRALVSSSRLRGLVEPILGQGVFPVRGIFFDKTPEANWVVPWHQDLSIAVQEQRELIGWGPWSVKAGVPHVQPPVALLERMVTTRIHLDDCRSENGPLLIFPGTHRLGRLNAAQIAAIYEEEEPLPCLAHSGDVFLMRPLLLHASGRGTAPAHRRILHIEWAAEALPEGLEWYERLV